MNTAGSRCRVSSEGEGGAVTTPPGPSGLRGRAGAVACPAALGSDTPVHNTAGRAMDGARPPSPGGMVRVRGPFDGSAAAKIGDAPLGGGASHAVRRGEPAGPSQCLFADAASRNCARSVQDAESGRMLGNLMWVVASVGAVRARLDAETETFVS